MERTEWNGGRARTVESLFFNSLPRRKGLLKILYIGKSIESLSSFSVVFSIERTFLSVCKGGALWKVSQRTPFTSHLYLLSGRETPPGSSKNLAKANSIARLRVERMSLHFSVYGVFTILGWKMGCSGTEAMYAREERPSFKKRVLHKEDNGE